MAIEQSDMQSIINSVLQSLRTNARTIEQLTPVSSLSDNDTLEIAGGKSVTFAVIKLLLMELLKKDIDSLQIKISQTGIKMSAVELDIENIKQQINTLLSVDNSDAIESFHEIVRFLAGISDKETLEGILAGIASQINAVDIKAGGKVDKVDGKGLSTNDYSNEEKEKLRELPESAVLATELGGKVDKVPGKGLSANDYTNEEKAKLSGVAENANNYVHPTTHPASIITEDATHRFMTDAERTKLSGVAEDANKYVHPATHPASMIVQSDERMFVSKEMLESLGRVVSNGIELLPVSMPDYYTIPAAPQRPDEGIFIVKGDPYDYFFVNKYGSIYTDADYNRYVSYMGAEVPQARTDKLYICGGRLYGYDGTGLVAFATVNDVQPGGGSSGDGGSFSGKAADIVTDAQHRFVTDAEKRKWNTPQLLPLDGFCESRAAMPSYGVWAFPESTGLWTVDGDFSKAGLARTDYCDRVGIDMSAYVPKLSVLFLCACNGDKCRKLYYADGLDNHALKPYAFGEDVADKVRCVEVLSVDSVVNSYDAVGMSEGDAVVLEQMSISGALKWVIRGDVTKYGSVADYGTVNEILSGVQGRTVIDPKAGLLLYDRGGRELYRTEAAGDDVASGGVTVMRYACVDATLDRLPKRWTIGVAGATTDGGRISDIVCSDDFTEGMLGSVRVGDTLVFAVGAEMQEAGIPNGLRGSMLVTNVWDDDGVWTVGFNVWGLDYFNVGRMWWSGSSACVKTCYVGEW